jgi:hypothetical protein
LCLKQRGTLQGGENMIIQYNETDRINIDDIQFISKRKNQWAIVVGSTGVFVDIPSGEKIIEAFDQQNRSFMYDYSDKESPDYKKKLYGRGND